MDINRHDWTVQELAEKWSCTTPTIYARLNDGTLTGFKVGSCTRISDESVARFENKNKYVPRA